MIRSAVAFSAIAFFSVCFSGLSVSAQTSGYDSSSSSTDASPTDSPSPSPSPSDSPSPSPSPKPKVCCDCFYMSGKYGGPKFVNRCAAWFASQKDCTDKYMTGYDPFPNDDSYFQPGRHQACGQPDGNNLPTNCDVTHTYYAGHGNASIAGLLPGLFSSCMSVSPNCSLYTYDSNACSVFSDPAKAGQAAQKIQSLLPPGCTASVQANQCEGASDKYGQIICQSEVQYYITQTCVQTKYNPCNSTGDICGYDDRGPNQDGSDPNTNKCTDSNGNVTSQKCCPDPSDPGYGTWSAPGQPCPSASPSTQPSTQPTTQPSDSSSSSGGGQ